jgi:hypothetical protein
MSGSLSSELTISMTTSAFCFGHLAKSALPLNLSATSSWLIEFSGLPLANPLLSLFQWLLSLPEPWGVSIAVRNTGKSDFHSSRHHARMRPSDRYIGSLTNDKESLPCNTFLHLLANSFLRLVRDQTKIDRRWRGWRGWRGLASCRIRRQALEFAR